MVELRSIRTVTLAKAIIHIPIVLALLAGCAVASVNEKSKVLEDLRRHFGRPLDTELNLYDLSKTLVVQASFQDDRLVALKIVPKYQFSDRHLSWNEPWDFPTISTKKYRDCLKKFALIKPIGGLLLSPTILFVSNSTAWKGEYFENAFIDTGFVGKQNRVRLVSVNYFSPLKGKVVSKIERMPGVCEVTLESEGKERKHRYYVKKDVFDSLSVDQVQSFEGAFVN